MYGLKRAARVGRTARFVLSGFWLTGICPVCSVAHINRLVNQSRRKGFR